MWTWQIQTNKCTYAYNFSEYRKLYLAFAPELMQN